MSRTATETSVLKDLDVVSWRFDCLERAGYPIEIAVALAEQPGVDLHLACQLLEKGATLSEALRILR